MDELVEILNILIMGAIISALFTIIVEALLEFFDKKKRIK